MMNNPDPKVGTNIVFIEKKCINCHRAVERKMEGLEGEGWEIREQFKTIRTKCWVCTCKELGPERHIDAFNYAVEHPCGC